jgi:hypothetical protein
MTTRWARFARGWIVALFASLVAALSHTLGGAAAPSGLAVGVSLAFAGMICVALIGRTVSTLRLTIAVLLSQIILHALFSFGGPGGTLTTDASATTGLHGHPAAASAFTGGAVTGGLGDAAGAALAHVSHAGGTMWLAHLAAAVVTIMALRYGEQAFWGLLANARLGIRSGIRSMISVQVPVAVPTTLRSALIFPACHPGSSRSRTRSDAHQPDLFGRRTEQHTHRTSPGGLPERPTLKGTTL